MQNHGGNYALELLTRLSAGELFEPESSCSLISGLSFLART